MTQVRIYGRRIPAGGGEFVAAAALLGRAAARAGLEVQLRPPWAFARGGVAEHATLRVESEPILDASLEYSLDLVAVADPSVVDEVDLLDGIRPDGVVLFAEEGPPTLHAFKGKVLAVGLGRLSSMHGVSLRYPLAWAVNSLLSIVPPEILEGVIRDDAPETKVREAIRQAADAVSAFRDASIR